MMCPSGETIGLLLGKNQFCSDLILFLLISEFCEAINQNLILIGAKKLKSFHPSMLHWRQKWDVLFK